MKEVYERRGLWYVKGKGRPYQSKWEAEGTSMPQEPSPLDKLKAQATVYNTFEEAMEDHGKDEDDFAEED